MWTNKNVIDGQHSIKVHAAVDYHRIPISCMSARQQLYLPVTDLTADAAHWLDGPAPLVDIGQLL